MAKDLSLIVNLKAIDKLTGPLKKIRGSSGKTAEALRASKEQLDSLQRSQRDISSYRKLQGAMRANQDALGGAQEKLRLMREEMKKTDAPTDKFQRQFLKTKDEVDKLTGKLGDQRRGLGNLRTSLRESGISADNLGRSEDQLATRIRETNTQFDAQKRKLGEIAEAQRRAQRAKDNFHRNIGRTNELRSAGVTGLATGGAALYGGARLLTPGIEYGETMSRVQALTRLNGDSEQMKALRQQARDLGSSTAFSASEVGQGQSFLAMAGFTPDAIHTAMQDMLNLALANDMDLGQTADISSNILSGFGLDSDQMGRVSDVLTATTTRANVDLQMLGESMKYVAPQARAMGLSLEQAAAMAGLLGNVGIQGSQAGTTLRAMMTRLAAPTGAAAGALEELGVNAKDAKGNMRDVPRILADVAKATENMGNADRASYLKAIFGEEPGAGMAELIGQQGAAGIEKFVDILKGSMGEAAKVAKTRADNIGGDLKGLRSAWEEVGISITDTNEGPLRDLIQTITAVTRGVGDWIKQNPELASAIAKAAAGLAALVAVGGAFTIMAASLLGPLVTVKFALEYLGLRAKGADSLLGKLAKGGLKALGGSLKWLGRIVAVVGRAFLLNPIGLAVTAIAGAAYLIYRNWDSIASFFKDRWRDVKAAFDDGVGGVMKLLANWSPLGLVYKGVIAILRKMGIEVPESIATLGDAIVNGLGAAWEGITNLWDWFKSAPGRAIDYVIDLVSNWDLMGQLKAKWDEAIDYLKSLPSRMLGAGKEAAVGLANGIKNGASSVVDGAKNMASGAVDSVKGLLDIHSPSRVFREIGVNTVEGLNQGLDKNADEPVKRVTDMTKRLRKAGAGLALGATMSLPAAAMPVEPSVANVPDLPAQHMEIQRAELPDLGELRAPRIQLPEMPALGTLAAPKIEAPELPELPALRLEIQKPELPALPPIEDARSVPIDSRPPLASPGSSEVHISIGDINVNAAPGMDEQALARYVAAEVQRALAAAQRDAAARTRRNLYDND